MATTRKQALKLLNGLLRQIQEHVELIASQPESPAVNHWKNEAHNWLRQMEEMLPHVGKKTAAKWQSNIRHCRDTLDAG